MRIITLEEHHDDPDICTAVMKAINSLPPNRRALYTFPPLFSQNSNPIFNVGEGRISAMDAGGIDMQVSGCGNNGFNLQLVNPREAAALCIPANDRFADVVKQYPTRFAGFATLPTNNPEAATLELERCVKKLGFKGAMIPCVTNGKMIDHPDFTPLLQMANDLDVPLYLHPTIVMDDVQNSYYKGINPALDFIFAGPGYGWHIETGISTLRLILSGGFEKYPKLNIIIGHWGEMLPYYMERIDSKFSQQVTKLPLQVSEYFKAHVYITPSGMFYNNPFELCMKTIGVDNILYAVDYPYVKCDGAHAFLENVNITSGDKEKIGHSNAEKLLKLNYDIS